MLATDDTEQKRFATKTLRHEGLIENPKSEARNTKQYPMIQIQMTKTIGRQVSVLNIGALVF